MKRRIDSAVIHMAGGTDTPDEHSIPVDQLIDMLQGLEDIVSGLADGRRLDFSDSRQRAQLTDDEKRHYRLFARPCEVGSFQQVVDLYDTRDSVQNLDPLFDGCETTFSEAIEIVHCVSNGDKEQFDELVRSSSVAARVLNGVEKMCPRGTETIELKKVDDAGKFKSVTIPPEAKARIIEWKTLCEGPFPKEVIAKVTAVDFDSKKLTLKPLGGGRKLKAPYSDELQDSVLKDVHEGKWKLLCTARMTPNGEIEEIESVEGLEQLSLRRDIEIDSFECGGKKITFRNPLIVSEALDSDIGQAFVVEVPDLDIIVYSEFQGELIPALRDELSNKWDWIVQCPDDELTPRALRVKRKFMSLVEGGAR